MPITMNGNQLSTEFEELTIDISDINLDIDWGSWSWWDYILDNTVGEIANLIVAYFNDSIEETLEAEMRNSVEPLLGDFFQSISYGTEISLSNPYQERSPLMPSLLMRVSPRGMVVLVCRPRRALRVKEQRFQKKPKAF